MVSASRVPDILGTRVRGNTNFKEERRSKERNNLETHISRRKELVCKICGKFWRQFGYGESQLTAQMAGSSMLCGGELVACFSARKTEFFWGTPNFFLNKNAKKEREENVD